MTKKHFIDQLSEVLVNAGLVHRVRYLETDTEQFVQIEERFGSKTTINVTANSHGAIMEAIGAAICGVTTSGEVRHPDRLRYVNKLFDLTDTEAKREFIWG